MAGIYGHVGATYLTDYIPAEVIPRGKKAAPKWIEGFALIFGTIHEIFNKGEIPTVGKLEDTLRGLPRDKIKLIDAWGKAGAEVDMALEALVQQAEMDWEEDFEATHGDSPEWRKASKSKCPKHDLNWVLAVDMLVG